ncbi:MAG: bifunctional glutamate--cysteine ligase GshA/glutathione synthetase GshB, partial [Eubacterium sp.]
ISTGGDSIDRTDAMPQAFKDIAVKAAAAVNAVFCGVDIIIEDYRDPQSPFGIIELNFNPSTDMHAYPSQGKERRTGEYILRALGLID